MGKEGSKLHRLLCRNLTTKLCYLPSNWIPLFGGLGLVYGWSKVAAAETLAPTFLFDFYTHQRPILHRLATTHTSDDRQIYCYDDLPDKESPEGLDTQPIPACHVFRPPLRYFLLQLGLDLVLESCGLGLLGLMVYQLVWLYRAKPWRWKAFVEERLPVGFVRKVERHQTGFLV